MKNSLMSRVTKGNNKRWAYFCSKSFMVGFVLKTFYYRKWSFSGTVAWHGLVGSKVRIVYDGNLRKIMTTLV